MNFHPIFQAALAPIIPPAPGLWQRRQAEIEQADAALDEHDDTCPVCNGSGEGQYDGTRCSTCRGSGVMK